MEVAVGIASKPDSHVDAAVQALAAASIACDSAPITSTDGRLSSWNSVSSSKAEARTRSTEHDGLPGKLEEPVQTRISPTTRGKLREGGISDGQTFHSRFREDFAKGIPRRNKECIQDLNRVFRDNLRGGEQERNRPPYVFLSRSRSEGRCGVSSDDTWADAGGDLLVKEYTVMSKAQQPVPRVTEHRGLDNFERKERTMHGSASFRPIGRSSGRIRRSSDKITAPDVSRPAEFPLDLTKEAQMRGSPYVPNDRHGSHLVSARASQGSTTDLSTAISYRDGTHIEPYGGTLAVSSSRTSTPVRHSPVGKSTTALPAAFMHADVSDDTQEWETGTQMVGPTDVNGIHYKLTIESVRGKSAYADTSIIGQKFSVVESPNAMCIATPGTDDDSYEGTNKEVQFDEDTTSASAALNTGAELKLSSWVHAMDLLLKAKGAAHSSAATSAALYSPPQPTTMIDHQRFPLRERRGEAPIFRPNSETGGHKLQFYPFKTSVERPKREAGTVTAGQFVEALDHKRIDFSHVASKRYACLETGEAASWDADASQGGGESDSLLTGYLPPNRKQASSVSHSLRLLEIQLTSADQQAPRALNSLSPAFAPTHSPKVAWQRIRTPVSQNRHSATTRISHAT